MDGEFYALISQFIGGVNSLLVFLAFLAAIVVAVIVTKRRQGAAGGWIMAVGLLGALVCHLLFIVADRVVMRMVGTSAWMFSVIALELGLMLAWLVVGGSFLLMKPVPSDPGQEAGHE